MTACRTNIVLIKAIPSLCLSVVPDFSPSALHQIFQILTIFQILCVWGRQFLAKKGAGRDTHFTPYPTHHTLTNNSRFFKTLLTRSNLAVTSTTHSLLRLLRLE